MSFHRPRDRTLPPLPKGPWESLTIAQAIRRTLTERGYSLRPNTIASWRSIARHFHKLLQVPISKLQPGDLTRYQRQRLEEGSSGNSIRLELSVAKSILLRLDLWRTLSKGLKLRNEPAARQGTALTTPQKERLLQTASQYPDLQDAIRLGLCGLRAGEILSLQTSDYEGGTLKIQPSKTKAGIRRIPLPPETQAALAARVTRIKEGPLFPSGPRGKTGTPRRSFWAS